MKNYILCSVEPEQIISYLNGEKDCELRKTKPHPENHINKTLKESEVILKTFGTNEGYLLGRVEDFVIGKPKEVYSEYKDVFEFGISKDKFFSYYDKRDRTVVIHFSDVLAIDPSLKNLPGTQTWKYVRKEKAKTKSLSDEKVKEKLIDKTKEIQKELERD